MPDHDTTYVFPPLERRGVLLGLQATQLLTLAAGVLVALLLRALLPASVGLVSAVSAFAGSAAVALCSRDGAPLCVWAATAAAFMLRSPGRVRLIEAPLHGGLHVDVDEPTAPPGIELLEERDMLGGSAAGVVRDRAGGVLAGVIPVRGQSFTLMDPFEQAQQLDAWRGVLGSVARPRTPVVRLQWIQRSRPMTTSRFPESGIATDGPPGGDAVSHVHAYESWLVLAVGQGRRVSRADGLFRELRLVLGQLHRAGLETGEILSPSELRALFDPDGSAGRSWPCAIGDQWSAARVDGWWHSTYWIAEWPRQEVGAAFLAPLLLGSGRRTVSVVMAPVPFDQALRQARSARTADIADDELRARAGYLPSVRREKESEGARSREIELADGHSEFRFSGYVTVTAPDPESLRTECAEAEHSAQAAHVELRRLYGRQAEAYSWTLPLARGLR